MLKNLITRDDHQWWIFSITNHATDEHGQVGADWIPEQFEHLDMDGEGQYTVTIRPSLKPLPQDEDNLACTFRGRWQAGDRGTHYTLAAMIFFVIGAIAINSVTPANDAVPTVEQARSCIEQQSGDRFSRRSFMACLD